jgi:hypothetical protein
MFTEDSLRISPGNQDLLDAIRKGTPRNDGYRGAKRGMTAVPGTTKTW